MCNLSLRNWYVWWCCCFEILGDNEGYSTSFVIIMPNGKKLLGLAWTWFAWVTDALKLSYCFSLTGFMPQWWTIFNAMDVFYICFMKCCIPDLLSSVWWLFAFHFRRMGCFIIDWLANGWKILYGRMCYQWFSFETKENADEYLKTNYGNKLSICWFL